VSEDFLKNPLSLFDVSGKTAIVTGASGAFGALAAKVLAGAGANVVIAAGNAAELEKVAESCKKLGGKVEALTKRPSSEANCEAIVKAAVERFGRLDHLSGPDHQQRQSVERHARRGSRRRADHARCRRRHWEKVRP